MKNGTSFFVYIYALNKLVVVLLMALLFFACAVLEGYLFAKAKDSTFGTSHGTDDALLKPCVSTKKALQALYIVAGLTFLTNILGILFKTIFTRSEGTYAVYMELFHAVKERPTFEENYRTLLMNALLYFPMGMAAVILLPKKWNVWLRVGIVFAFGFVFSCGCEHTQYALQIGAAEADDVLMNTTGSLLGALHLPLGEFLAKHDVVRRFWAWLHR